jgi:4-amino-4-deoxy-L-arabinose transferase-like glycosyltransferase
LIAVYLIVGCLHAALVPTGQTGYQNAPDEAAHVNYVRILRTGRLPAKNDEVRRDGLSTYEWHQPPLYYAIEAIVSGGGIRAMRFLSLLMGAGCIVLIYRLALLLLPEDPEVALLASAVAALTPGHIAITSTVNNDVLLELLFSTSLFLLVSAMRSGLNGWRAGWLGVAVGAALMTKSTALLLLPVVLLGLILLRRSGEPTSDLIRNALWFVGVVLVLTGWWYARNGVLYHEWLPIHQFEQSFQGTAQAQDVVSGKIRLQTPVNGWTDYWVYVTEKSFQSFWAVFGTPLAARYGVPVFLPDPIYLLLGVVSAVAFGGLIRLHLRRSSLFTEYQIGALWLLFACIGLVALAFAAFLSHYFQTQGRYLYPAMSALSIALALGWRAAFPDRYRAIASWGLALLLGITTAVFLVSVQAAASP